MCDSKIAFQHLEKNLNKNKKIKITETILMSIGERLQLVKKINDLFRFDLVQFYNLNEDYNVCQKPDNKLFSKNFLKFWQ